MERWRWMPRDMGQERIEVNIPDYTVRVYRGETIIHQARVIVGKPQTPTPIFSNSMQFLIVNPYWNVPPSIIKKEMLPKLKEDPDYLKKLGYEVLPQKGGGFAVRQPPGERNALGWIKFMFPNEHSVYLHDTPTRNLFANAKRAFSHGCVRVDQPFSLAEIVLGDGWTEERVKGLKGGGERMVKMPRPLPIHIGYFSAFVDEHGKLQLREDIYGYSQKVKAALGLSV
jgi:murein L,D-transpeptidase YcbB/YkuD